MKRPQPPGHAVEVIRFTRRIARQCARAGSRVPDWMVCDTIANGARRALRGLGSRGGTVLLFTRTYRAGTRKGTGSRVSVLGELTPRGCFALQLISPAKGGKKTGNVWDF
jgi:hypothetical protein